MQREISRTGRAPCLRAASSRRRFNGRSFDCRHSAERRKGDFGDGNLHPETSTVFHFDRRFMTTECTRVRQGKGGGRIEIGPNIGDWPPMQPLSENLLLSVASVIRDPVTTTDELIPSGEASPTGPIRRSWRSSPCPGKTRVRWKGQSRPGDRGKEAEGVSLRRTGRRIDQALFTGVREKTADPRRSGFLESHCCGKRRLCHETRRRFRPGTGGLLPEGPGGQANIAVEYATKRYKSNLINWGCCPSRLNRKPRRSWLSAI